jgi:hypothetical protein
LSRAAITGSGGRGSDLVYLYFDPVDLLSKEGQERWARPAEHQKMVDEAIGAAGLTGMPLAVA